MRIRRIYAGGRVIVRHIRAIGVQVARIYIIEVGTRRINQEQNLSHLYDGPLGVQAGGGVTGVIGGVTGLCVD